MGSISGKGTKDRAGPVMDPVTLRFVDCELEHQFRSSWRSANRSLSFWWRAGSLLYYILFSVLLAMIDPQSSVTLNAVHLFVCLPLMAVTTFAPMLHPPLERTCNGLFLFLVMLVFSVGCLQVRVAATPVAYLYLFHVTVIMIFMQHFPSNRLMAAIVSSVVFGVIAGFSCYALGGSPLGDEVPMLPFCGILVAFTIIGMFSAYNREFFIRRNYHSIQSLKAENARSAKLADDAVASLEAKSRFLAIVGHELRTPLNAIIGFSELLLSGVVGEVKPERAVGYVGNIHNSGAHLLSLVNRVLDYTNAGSGMIRLEESIVSPGKLLANVAAESESTLRRRLQALELQVPDAVPDLRIDQRLVGQCLANLLSNASKFSGIESVISCTVALDPDKSVRISVADTGDGFDQSISESLFDPFAQAEDGLDRSNEGLGIGLPLSRVLMQAHDGDVRIASRLGVGTVATLIFPRDRSVINPEPLQTAAA